MLWIWLYKRLIIAIFAVLRLGSKGLLMVINLPYGSKNQLNSEYRHDRLQEDYDWGTLEASRVRGGC